MSESTSANQITTHDGRRLYFAVHGISMAGSGLIIPLTAIFLHQILGIGTSLVGFYFLGVALMSFMVNPIFGKFAQRSGPLLPALVALILQALGNVTLGVGLNHWAVVPAAILSGAGVGGYYAVQVAAIIYLFGREDFGRFYGSLNKITNFAFGCATLVSGLLAASGELGFRLLFDLNAVSCVIFGIVLVTKVRKDSGKSFVQRPSSEEGETARVRKDNSGPWRNGAFRWLLVAQFLFCFFGFAQFESVAPFVFRESGRIPLSLITIAVATNCAVVILIQGQATNLSRRLGLRELLPIAPVLLVVSAVFGLVSTEFHVLWAQVVFMILYFVLFAAGEVVLASTVRPLAVVMAPRNEVTNYTAAISRMMSPAQIFGPLLALLIVGSLGPSAYWVFVVAGLVLSIVISLKLRTGDVLSVAG